MNEMKIPKWQQELDRFLPIKTVFLLEGNIYDLQGYPVQTEEGTRQDLVMLDHYLYKYLSGKGYESIAFYNHLDGFYNEFSGDSVRKFLTLGGVKNPGENVKSYSIQLAQAANFIHTVFQNKEEPAAVVMTLSSRYVLSAERLSDEESKIFTRLMTTTLKKNQVKTENGFRNHLLFLICEKANDIPAWFYLENPMAKILTVSPPDRQGRKLFFDSQKSVFLKGREFSKEEMNRYREQFADLTDGFQNLELNALKILFRNENCEPSELHGAVNLYKYGLKDNPWKEIPREKLSHGEEIIHTRVKGQQHAVVRALDIIKRAALGMSGLQHSGVTKPKGILFFAGPTGTGKTELAKTLAELLFGDENACIRFDMSEYQQSHSDQKLLGAPPGYVGYESGGQLTNAVREKPFSILLFDEIEKAHPSVFDKFLQILEDGRITDGKGETVYFSECIIIFTSNLGVYDTDASGQRKLNISPEMPYEQMRERLLHSVEDFFKRQLGRPEILNRIGDNFVVFDFIRPEVAKEILSAQLEKISAALERDQGIYLSTGDHAREFLREKAFGNLENGGRGIGNVVEKYLINPLARELFDREVPSGSRVLLKEIKENQSIVTIDCEIMPG